MVVPTFAKKVLKKAINRFIWKNKNEKQTYDQKASKSLTDERLMAQEVGKGGLKSLHLESEINAFAAKWVSRYLSPSNPTWKDFITAKITEATQQLPLPDHPIEYYFTMQIPKSWVKTIANTVGGIWQPAITTWCKALPQNKKPLHEYSIPEIANQPLHYNPLICHTTKSKLLYDVRAVPRTPTDPKSCQFCTKWVATDKLHRAL